MAQVSITTQSSNSASQLHSLSSKGIARRVSGWPVVGMLAWREWTRFFRQRARVIAALGQPILFWILFGTGMHGAFRVDGSPDFMTYYLPGTVALILMFTAIFTTISIIEDRKEGFLQSVLVAPVGRWTISAGKILGGGMIAWVQAILFLLLALALGFIPWGWQLIPCLALMAITAAGLSGLGVSFAWPMESTQGFHAVMNLVLMPMWLLSGAFFPIPMLGDPAVGESNPLGQVIIHWIMRCNPLTYAISGMRQMMFPDAIGSAGSYVPSLNLCWVITIVGTIATISISFLVVRRTTRGDLQ